MARTCALAVGLLLLATPAAAQLKIATGSASAAADAVVDRIDAGSGPGTLVIFGSACPDAANDADSGTILAVLTFSDPAFGSASNGVATANAITADASANATGTAMCFRAKDSNAVVVLQGRITTSGGGGELILSSTSIKTGQSVAVSDLTYTQPTQTADIFAPTCSASDVQTALNAASAGDVIAIPAGTCTWTTQVAWTAPANVTVFGAGSLSTQGGGDVTVITDNYASGAPLLALTVASTGTFRLAGLTFQGGSGSAKTGGIINLDGPGTVRLDHLHINMQSYSPAVTTRVLYVGDGIRGVLHNAILDLYGLTWIHIVNGVTNGDVEWAAATGFGTNDFFYIEDNQVNGATSNTVYDSALTDCHTGGKFVARFNTLVATVLSQTHPTGHSAGDDRGCRAHENYGNLVTSPLAKDPNFAFDYNNSGGGMVWGNSLDQVYKNILYLNICRTAAGDCSYTQNTPPAGWGYCNGSSPWDDNNEPGDDNICIDQPGRGQGDLLVGSYLTSNRRNNTTGTQVWPNQVLEPVYEWSTTGDIVAGWGGTWFTNLVTGILVANRDYYLGHGNASCNAGAGSCTAGVGVGTLANRPASCTAGVAYFASDQGAWNTSASNPYGVNQSGADGVLYKCTATNTWTSYYTPYTYPHPLR